MPDTATKPRIDAWDAALTDAQRWSVYDKLRTLPWYKVAQWASAEFGLASEPSRAAMYRFADRMRGQESARRQPHGAAPVLDHGGGPDGEKELGARG